MDGSIKLLLFTILCSAFLPKIANSQGYRSYKHKDVNQYEIRNGKYRIIPSTTRPPSLIETFFPWTGSAYTSARTPEEDAAILNSLIDPDPTPSSSSDSDGIMSWLSMPTIPSLPGFGSTTSGSVNESPTAQTLPRPSFPPSMSSPTNYHNINMLGAPSQNEPIAVPPPGAENNLGMFPSSSLSAPVPQQQYQPGQYPQSPQNYNIPQEIRNNMSPTFQFHQQVKDSIPIPSPTLQGLGQSMFPYPYSAGNSLDFGKGTPEKSPTILETISNYFQFGKRNDLEGQLTILDEDVMQPRSFDSNGEYEAENGDAYENVAPMDNDSSSASSPSATPAAPDSKAFPCPKSGIWRWNGEVCIAVGPVPIWACRPNDLIVSGKIAICRNKIYFSPKIINNDILNKANIN